MPPTTPSRLLYQKRKAGQAIQTDQSSIKSPGAGRKTRHKGIEQKQNSPSRFFLVLFPSVRLYFCLPLIEVGVIGEHARDPPPRVFTSVGGRHLGDTYLAAMNLPGNGTVQHVKILS